MSCHKTIFFLLLFLSFNVLAAPATLNFQANIRKPDHSALESSSVSFRFYYLNDAGTCTVYTEDFNNVSMVGSGGNVSLKLGDGSKVFPPTATTLNQTFSNRATNVMACAEGGTYSPTLFTEKRNLRVEFVYTGSGGVQSISGIEINSIPYAMYASDADQLGGFAANLYTKFSDVTTCTGGNLLQFNGTAFSCIAPGGGSSQWTTNVTDIYFNTGNVAVGTTTPTSRLTVTGGTATIPAVRVNSTYSQNWTTQPADVAFASTNTIGSGISLLPSASGAYSNGWTVYAGASGSAIGDGSFGIWNATTADAKFMINQAGNIGIGRNTANYKLDVNGDINIPAGSNFKINGVNVGLGTVTGTGTINQISKFTAAGTIGDSILTDDGTNVGVGTNAPLLPLSVAGSTIFDVSNTVTTLGTGVSDFNFVGDVRVFNSGITDLSGQPNLTIAPNLITFSNGGGGNETSIGGNVVLALDANHPTNGEIEFKTGGTEKMRIINSGYVGIGTVTPSAKLSVKGDGITTGAALSVEDSTGTQQVIIQDNGQVGIGATPFNGYTNNGNDSELTVLDGMNFISDGSFASEGKFYFGTHNVGWRQWTIDVANTAILFNGAGGSSNVLIGTEEVAGTLGLVSGNVEAVRIDSAGNMGIGKTNPAYKLDVNGDIGLAGGSSLFFGVTPICTIGGCVSPSDLRLKENIKPLNNSLSKILRLQGVEYDYKDKAQFGSQHQVGVIAQDLEKVFPEVVVTNEKTGLKAVAYDHLVAPLIEAVKALHSHLLNHDREIAAVKAENNLLKQENSEIKAYLCRKDPEAAICKP